MLRLHFPRVSKYQRYLVYMDPVNTYSHKYCDMVLNLNYLGMTTTRDMRDDLIVDDNYTYPGGPLWDGEKYIVDKPVDLL
jgi:hypothetical protein